VPGPSDRYGLGVLLAALTGFTLWRFRARTSSLVAIDLPAEVPLTALSVADPPAVRFDRPDPLD
jgi:hypothetical protein